jgi:hypothetical protein
MNEEKIQELLDGELGKPITVRFQKKLLDSVLGAGKKKYGAISEGAIQPESLRYFLARGVISWEEENKICPKKNRHTPTPTSTLRL